MEKSKNSKTKGRLARSPRGPRGSRRRQASPECYTPDPVTVDLQQIHGQKSVKPKLKKRLQLREEKSKGAELLQSENAWEAKYYAMEEQFNKDMAEKNQIWETKVKQLENEKKELENKFTQDLAIKHQNWETEYKALEDKSSQFLANKQRVFEIFQTELQKKVNKMEELNCKMNSAILDLSKDKDGLSLKLKETSDLLQSKGAELLQSEKAWEAKYNAMEEKFSKDLEKNQIWETEIKEMETKLKQVEDEKKDLAEKHQSREAEMKLMVQRVKEMEDNLAQEHRRWETKEKEAKDEKKELEDICLMMKKKRRCFFSRKNTEDREETLQKMKLKMQKKRERQQ